MTSIYWTDFVNNLSDIIKSNEFKMDMLKIGKDILKLDANKSKLCNMMMSAIYHQKDNDDDKKHNKVTNDAMYDILKKAFRPRISPSGLYIYSCTLLCCFADM